jgi:hypothetical protein
MNATRSETLPENATTGYVAPEVADDGTVKVQVAVPELEVVPPQTEVPVPTLPMRFQKTA